MEIRVTGGDITQAKADAIIVNLFEGVTVPGGGTGAVDSALGGAISQLIAQGDIRGKSGEFTVIHAFGKLPAPRVVVAGLGKQKDFDIDAVRNLAANLARFVRKPGIKTVATIAHGAGIAGLDPDACAQAIAEGAIMGEYRFLKHKAADNERLDLDSLTIVEHDAGTVERMAAAAVRGAIMGVATNLARDL
ncbi:MAG TPA: M17 family peptidase N-terminal domain-containing protein, partial [Tepidiformaceae bacterium]|nr:M17 family peptidase N-terminal domain-containing protein [Tepidiformaceae bacterium]